MYAHSIHNPDRVRFLGPLTPLAAELRGEFARLGYSTSSATVQLQLAAHLSRWLQAEGLGTQDLTGPVIERFLATRRREYRGLYSMQALEPLLAYLRRVGAAPEPVALEPCSGSDRLLARFGDYLRVERGLTAPVVQAYTHWVRPFVEQVVGAGEEPDLGTLGAVDVQRFLVANLPGLSRKSAQMTACALRSFLRFCYVEGIVAVSLVGAVPAVAHRKLTGLPQDLAGGQVDSLLDACDRRTSVGRRDYAVIVCLHRLGLRCGEATAVMLDHIDWETGTLMIRGKGGRNDRLPLPVDVGQALVDYLRQGRPDTSSRAVFVRAHAPFTAMTRSGLSCVVARAARRAGMGTVHAHRLRHTAATRAERRGEPGRGRPAASPCRHRDHDDLRQD